MRLAASLTRHVGRFALIGVVESDPDETRAQKATLTLVAVCVTGLAVIWVGTYWLLGLPRAPSGGRRKPGLHQLVDAVAH